jgi:hypothetical protein
MGRESYALPTKCIASRSVTMDDLLNYRLTAPCPGVTAAVGKSPNLVAVGKSPNPVAVEGRCPWKVRVKTLKVLDLATPVFYVMTETSR